MASPIRTPNWTYKLGGNWAVNRWLRFRATYGTSFRAPALFEQFKANESGFVSASRNDPCRRVDANLSQGNIGQLQHDRCVQELIGLGLTPTEAGNYPGGPVSANVRSQGGIGVLDPETSTAKTASVILTPTFSFLPDTRLSVAVDYFDIQVKGEVSQLGAQDQPVDVAEPAGGCVLVGRDGRQRGSPDPRLDHVDGGVTGDDEEPVHQRAARGIERRAGPPGPQEGFLDDIFGEVGVDDDPPGAGEQASVRPAGPLRVNNGEALMPALLAGLGIADLPDFIVGDAIASGEVEVILKGWKQTEGAVHLVTPSGGPRPARVEVLADFLTQHFATGKKRAK